MLTIATYFYLIWMNHIAPRTLEHRQLFSRLFFFWTRRVHRHTQYTYTHNASTDLQTFGACYKQCFDIFSLLSYIYDIWYCIKRSLTIGLGLQPPQAQQAPLQIQSSIISQQAVAAAAAQQQYVPVSMVETGRQMLLTVNKTKLLHFSYK